MSLVVVLLLLLGGALQSQSRTPGDQERTEDIVSRARGAQRVVVAKVVAVEPMTVRNASGDLLIISRTTLAVEEVFKGEADATLVLDVEGGTFGGVTLEVSDMPSLTPGDRGVFFLSPTYDGTHALHRRGRGMLRLR